MGLTTYIFVQHLLCSLLSCDSSEHTGCVFFAPSHLVIDLFHSPMLSYTVFYDGIYHKKKVHLTSGPNFQVEVSIAQPLPQLATANRIWLLPRKINGLLFCLCLRQLNSQLNFEIIYIYILRQKKELAIFRICLQSIIIFRIWL